jgi:hypothetical protein
MNERSHELLRLYERYRIEDMHRFYTARESQFDRAANQGLVISAILLGFATAVGALAGTAIGWATGWSALAAILPAASTALTAYVTLYDPEQQSSIYRDAGQAIQEATRFAKKSGLPSGSYPSETEIAELIKRVEGALRKEHSQWGRLTFQKPIVDHTEE